MKTPFIVLLFLMLPFNASAEDKIFLYGDYYYGMSKEELFKSGPAQCDSYQDGQMVCNRQRVKFGDFEWTQFFEFHNDGLKCVSFGQPLSMAAVGAALAWFMEESYVPVDVAADNDSVNFFPLYDRNQNPEFEKEYEGFNNILSSSDNIHSFLLKKPILNEYMKTGKLPEDAIVATLGGSKSQGNLFVCFELAKNIKMASRN